MKVLLSDSTPAYLAPGGKQVHAEKLFTSLNKIGVETEFDRWWDPSQKCDILHLFGISNLAQIRLAKRAGVKIVLTQVVDNATNSSYIHKAKLEVKNKVLKKIFPTFLTKDIPWLILNELDAIVYINDFDRQIAKRIYSIDKPLTYTIPHGFDGAEADLLKKTDSLEKKTYLISVGSIIPRKNSLLLAECALNARIPIIFVGSPMKGDDEYFKKYLNCIDNNYVKYYGFVSQVDKYELLANASGFVLLSDAESGCIAVHEAASMGLPLLLSDKPWSHAYSNPRNVFYSVINKPSCIEKNLVDFFDTSKRSEEKSFNVLTWEEVALAYKKVYDLL